MLFKGNKPGMALQVHCPEVLKTKVNLEILLRSPRTTVAVITK